nr:hypothetical protein [Tanacetum cinerariifolium]
MSFSKLLDIDAVCYTKPLYSLKGWNGHFFWIDAFACPALFLWHIGKSVSRDVIPKSSEFSPEHYATLVAYPALFHKYSEPFLCLVGMSRRVVSLLSVALDRSSGELKASVDKLFDEGEVVSRRSRRQKKRKTKVADAGEPSHPAKKLRDDYKASCGPTVGGKS